MYGEEGVITPLKNPRSYRVRVPRDPQGGGPGSQIHRAVAADQGVHLTRGFVGDVSAITLNRYDPDGGQVH